MKLETHIKIILLSLICMSCNSVKYYEYYVKAKTIKDREIYCTLEVTKDKIIYRSSLYGPVSFEKGNLPFLYIEIENKDESNTFKVGDFYKLIYYEYVKYTYNGYVNYSEIDVKYDKYEYIQDSLNGVYKGEWYGPLSNEDKEEFPNYYKKENSYKIKGEMKQDWDYQFEHGYLNAVTMWFPAELKRTRKIDYSKFSVERDLIDTVTDSVKNNKVDRHRYM
ncbi:hypothetical protein [Myroides sp. DF42-4-2]|uniref:hypothetical protein n=1 Tax=Myroides sp. DF42-4-2 TaxID=2746726 RepID=UPI0025750782|nr:hypothetical protein [Myroides sp. DF42-4-2]MDM1409100.1 hypothetical protein [Myroides sp. DF42-4-2]